MERKETVDRTQVQEESETERKGKKTKQQMNRVAAVWCKEKKIQMWVHEANGESEETRDEGKKKVNEG